MANWTGNAYVDSLLLGEKWDTTNLTYYLGGGTATWNSVETAAIQAALQSWADVANLTFTQTFIQANADLVENQNIDVAGNLGVHTVHNNYATSTLQANAAQLTGTYNTNGYGWDENSATGGLQVGGLGYLTLVHELGHGLGLDHTHDDGGGNVNFFPGVTSSLSSGNNALNQDVFSAMSYVHGLVGKGINGGANADNYGFIAGPMAFDIAAIQYTYGANTTQNSGNNTYILPDANAGGTYFSALWDTGGIDEIIYQGATDTVIDLRSATLSDQVGGGGFLSQTSGITGGFTIAGDFTNALTDVNGETGVIIENASGGSGSDTLTGNNVANVLNGNVGNDTITAAGGNDTVNGGIGVDTLNGDAGADTLVGGADSDIINGGAGADIIYGDNLDGSGRTGTSAITLGSGTINKAGGNVSIATAQDISTQFSLGTNAEIVSSSSIPHVSVSGTGDGNVDYYKITLNSSNVVISLDIDHANDVGAGQFDSEISIYLANGTLVKNNDDTTTIDQGSSSNRDSSLTHTFVDAGTYYIAVGNYSSLSTDPGTIATGGTYVLQVSVSGELINNNDTIYGGADNDIIHASVGNDVIDGGTGTDTAAYSGSRADYDLVSHNGSVSVISHTGISEGTDTLTSIEQLQFADGIRDLTTTPIEQIFDREETTNADGSSFVRQFDWKAVTTWSEIHSRYDTANRLDWQQTFDDGNQGLTSIDYDQAATAIWDHTVSRYDAVNRLDWQQTFDDGNQGLTSIDYDQAATAIWDHTVSRYDAVNRLDWQQTFDDGNQGLTSIDYDQAATAIWDHTVSRYDATNALDWRQTFDDGNQGMTSIDYDQAGTATWDHTVSRYDATNALDWRQTFDDGNQGLTSIDYDQAGTATWDHTVSRYDATNALDWQQIFSDGNQGMTSIDYDQEAIYTWSRIETHFDSAGNITTTDVYDNSGLLVL